MTEPDLNALLESLKAGRRPDDLAERISRSIGMRPRRLPSRTTLAIEAAASRLTVATLVLCVVALAVSFARRAPGAEQQASVIEAALEGKTLRAQDVYAAMTGISGHREAGQ